jgi:4-oxalocrotonate tautomerase
MPVVIVEMLEGRTAEQKRALIAAITRALAETVNAAPASTTVIIHDNARTSWGREGRPMSDR